MGEGEGHLLREKGRQGWHGPRGQGVATYQPRTHPARGAGQHRLRRPPLCGGPERVLWLYETWESEEAVEAHESGEAFEEYMKRLRPLVEGSSVVRGNTTPIDVLGYYK